MERTMSEEDREKIRAALAGRYRRVARTPEGSFAYPTGEAGLLKLAYDQMPGGLHRLPPAVRSSFCGVGNPFRLGTVAPTWTVLDVGCGAGVDTLLGALATQGGGEALGVEPSPKMRHRAEENRGLAGVDNARFLDGDAEHLPVNENTVDLVISNGVFNLVPDKARGLGEVYRVLRSGGVLWMADQILVAGATVDPESRVALWAG